MNNQPSNPRPEPVLAAQRAALASANSREAETSTSPVVAGITQLGRGYVHLAEGGSPADMTDSELLRKGRLPAAGLIFLATAAIITSGLGQKIANTVGSIRSDGDVAAQEHKHNMEVRDTTGQDFLRANDIVHNLPKQP